MTNDTVLDGFNGKRTMIISIVKIKIIVIEYLLRYNGFNVIVVEWKINGKRTGRRPRKCFLK